MPNIQVDHEDAVICFDMCMQLGAPHGEFEGALTKSFPNRIRLEEGPLRLLQNMWRKYYQHDTKKHEEVGIDVALAEQNLKDSKQ